MPDLLSKKEWEANALAWVKAIDENLDPFRKYVLDPALEGLLPKWLRGKCLDVGCGEGIVSRYLAKHDCEVRFVDPKPSLSKDRGMGPESETGESLWLENLIPV